MRILIKDEVVHIDDEDAGLVGGYRWTLLRGRRTTYALGSRPRQGGRNVLMHRLILGVQAQGRGLQVDHADGDGLNNRRRNLRLCTPAQNLANSRKLNTRPATARFKGVCRQSGRRASGGRPWRAQIMVGGRQLYLGSFATEEGAACAYDRAAVEHYGPFARTNGRPRGGSVNPSCTWR